MQNIEGNDDLCLTSFDINKKADSLILDVLRDQPTNTQAALLMLTPNGVTRVLKLAGKWGLFSLVSQHATVVHVHKLQ